VQRLFRLSLASLSVARVILGLTLVASTWCSTVPSVSADSEPTCHLACCAGRAVHKAGSCMNGSCHAFGGGSVRPHLHQESKPETLCGLEKIIKGPGWSSISRGLNAGINELKGRSHSPSSKRSLTTTAITKPCQPECGNATGFANSNQRNHSCAAAENSQSLSLSFGYNTQSQQERALNPARRKGAPRGPPHDFS
jgi:hypothetical protein